jgi:hypothetical protein
MFYCFNIRGIARVLVAMGDGRDRSWITDKTRSEAVTAFWLNQKDS